MKQRRNRRFLSLLVLALIWTGCAVPVHAGVRDKLTYSVEVASAKGGSVYWDYDSSLSFFCKGVDAYRQSCRADGRTTRLTALSSRGLIPLSQEGWYFDGFRDTSGKRVTLESQMLSLIRVTVKGLYFYDCVPAYEDPAFRNMTKSAYQKLTKATVKALYGVSQYKVLGSVTRFQVPKKTQKLVPRFCQKTLPKPAAGLTVQKTVGVKAFSLAGGLPAGLACTYTSSNSKVVSVAKTTGIVTVRGAGIATVTIKLPETATTLGGKQKVRVTVLPGKTTLSAAKMKKLTASKGTLTVRWTADATCSGYQLQVCADKTCKTLIAKKTVTSGKTKTTTVTCTKPGKCRWVRIRAYKKSCGQTLYGPWTVRAVA